MKIKVAQRYQITVPEKIDENWENVMKETKGAWRKHPMFKDMDNAVEIVNWMRGKNKR